MTSGHGSQDPRADRGRHVLAVLPGDRSTLQLPRRRHRPDARVDLRDGGLSLDDPSRPGLRIHQPGPSERRNAGLLPAKQAHG